MSAVKPATAYVDPSGHVIVPVLKFIEREDSLIPTSPNPIVHTLTHPSLPSGPPTSTQFATSPSHPSFDSFSLMSPTRTEFSTKPFDRESLLASLGMGSMRAEDQPQQQQCGPRRRSLSLRNQRGGLQPGGRKLVGKISSPSLREQRELLDLQAKIEASLNVGRPATAAVNTIVPGGSPPLGIEHMDGSQVKDEMMSPRAEEFMNNPFSWNLTPDKGAADAGGVKSEGAEVAAPPPPMVEDPRSPAMKGASPITRNIEDVL
jgi:tyrosine-protein phosphatase